MEFWRYVMIGSFLYSTLSQGFQILPAFLVGPLSYMYVWVAWSFESLEYLGGLLEEIGDVLIIFKGISSYKCSIYLKHVNSG